jgi:signal transduction histidine kinase
MIVRLVSKDKRLNRLCREVMAAFPDQHWTLVGGDGPAERSGTDLNIWDYDPQLPIPSSLDVAEEQKHLFLVQRREMNSFRERLPLAAVSILLKPVNHVTLRAFLEQAVARCQARSSNREEEVTALRRERDELLDCLMHANLRLQEYDQDRTNFLARAIHDFRAPLMAVGGYCGLLLDQQLGSLNETQVEVLERMQHSVKRLNRLTRAMFQLSVYRQVERPPDMKKGDVQLCIYQAVHELSPFAEERDIDIEVNLALAPQPLYFESEQIEQVLVNILDNACKFTPKHGTIQVTGYPMFWDRRAPRISDDKERTDRRKLSSDEPNAYRVDIRDNGPGIPPEHRERIFEEYTTFTSGKSRAGSGLGLAISKMIITAHRGRIWVESGEGGTTFSFVLPFGQPEGELAPAEPGKALGSTPGTFLARRTAR